MSFAGGSPLAEIRVTGWRERRCTSMAESRPGRSKVQVILIILKGTRFSFFPNATRPELDSNASMYVIEFR